MSVRKVLTSVVSCTELSAVWAKRRQSAFRNSFCIPGGGLQTQLDTTRPQHGRAFLTVGVFVQGLLCSRASLYCRCFLVLYRLRTCFGSMLRNLTCFLLARPMIESPAERRAALAKVMPRQRKSSHTHLSQHDTYDLDAMRRQPYPHHSFR